MSVLVLLPSFADSSHLLFGGYLVIISTSYGRALQPTSPWNGQTGKLRWTTVLLTEELCHSIDTKTRGLSRCGTVGRVIANRYYWGQMMAILLSWRVIWVLAIGSGCGNWKISRIFTILDFGIIWWMCSFPGDGSNGVLNLQENSLLRV